MLGNTLSIELLAKHSFKQSLDLFDAIIARKIVTTAKCVKGVNVLWNPKLVEYVEHLSRPRCKYETVRAKIAFTYINICVEARHYQKLFDFFLLLKGIKEEICKDYVLMMAACSCLRGAAEIVRSMLELQLEKRKAEPPTQKLSLKSAILQAANTIRLDEANSDFHEGRNLSAEEEIPLRNSYVIYLEGVELSCTIASALPRESERLVKVTGTLLGDAYDKLVSPPKQVSKSQKVFQSQR